MAGSFSDLQRLSLERIDSNSIWAPSVCGGKIHSAGCGRRPAAERHCCQCHDQCVREERWVPSLIRNKKETETSGHILLALAGAQQEMRIGMTPINNPLWFPSRQSPSSSFSTPGRSVPTYRTSKMFGGCCFMAWFHGGESGVSKISWVSGARWSETYEGLSDSEHLRLNSNEFKLSRHGGSTPSQLVQFLVFLGVGIYPKGCFEGVSSS